jgi:D-glycero-D-manno-heptose 1,7-bisphosphate phosphatase
MTLEAMHGGAKTAMKILFLDCDGTIRKPIEGEFINDDYENQEPIDGAKEKVSEYSREGWVVVGITNQGGVECKHKKLGNCLKEQNYTLNFFPTIMSIYLCPDMQGNEVLKVVRGKDTSEYIDEKLKAKYRGKYRKPGEGMLLLALDSIGSSGSKNNVLVVGDRDEDRQCAANAGVNFMTAEDWLRSKVYQIKEESEETKDLYEPIPLTEPVVYELVAEDGSKTKKILSPIPEETEILNPGNPTSSMSQVFGSGIGKPLYKQQ